MDWIQREPFWFDCPLFADDLLGREALEGLEAPPEVVSADEVGHVISQLVMVIVVEAFDGRVLDRAVHPFDPLPGRCLPANTERGAIRPWMLDFGQPVFDVMLAADAVEEVLEGMNVPVVVGELDAIACWELSAVEGYGGLRSLQNCAAGGHNRVSGLYGGFANHTTEETGHGQG